MTIATIQSVVADAAEDYRRERSAVHAAIREHLEESMQDPPKTRTPGLDYQGRFDAPSPAEASTEIGTEDDRAHPLAVFIGMRNALLLMSIVALIVCGIAVLIVGWP
jgi:hypothetical protein